VGQFGDPALPPGPGYGNGSGGANGARGVIASTGFGNGVAVPPPSNPRRTGTVQTAGFSNSNDQIVEAPKRKVDEGPAVEPVVILAKPKPIYTAEAIKLNLEGEVLLDVVFPASGGEVQVNRVVKGLGHGLDEAAIRAAQQIKYKPAMSGGHPVDFPAVVHIVFQVAY
jgi:TonB family protein